MMLTNASEHCLTCPQREVGVSRILPDGTGSSGVVLVGDSPWLDEVRMGRNFSGAAGSLLNRLIKAVAREREEFITANVLWCKPPVLGWTDKFASYEARSCCRPHLEELLRGAQPRCIVPMGNVALSRICDCTGIEAHHGYVHETPYGLAVPTFHPAYLIRGTSEVEGVKSRNLRYFPVVVFALQRALEVASGRWHQTPVEYLLDPMLEDAKAYVERCRERQLADASGVYSFSCSNVVSGEHSSSNSSGGVHVAPTPEPQRAPIPLLFLDLETPESSAFEGQDEEPPTLAGRRLKLAGPILRCSFSLWPGTAVSFPWQEPFISWAKGVINNASAIAAWNGYDADFPKLRAEGVLSESTQAQVGGLARWPILVDSMWAWHFLQSDLPKALGFVAPFFYDGPAWKHRAQADPPYYNAVDSDAGLRALLGTRQALERQGRWQRFVRHCIATQPVLDRMGFIAVDRDEQQAFQARLKQEYDIAYAELQRVVPDAVKPVKRWKRAPKDMAGVRVVKVPTGEEQGLLPLEVPDE